MKVITTHLFPTSSPEFARQALNCIFDTKDETDKAINVIKQITGAKYVILTQSGRSALSTVFSALDIGNKEVLLQSFTCSVVPASVLVNQGLPVFCDIDPNTLTLSPQSVKSHLTTRTKALIFQHTFGSSQHLGKIKTICNSSKSKIHLIEDKAHILSYLSPDTEIAIGSFGRTKWLSGITGGYILTNNQKLYQKMLTIESQKSPLNQPQIYKYLFEPVLLEFAIRPLLGKLKIGETLLEISHMLGVLSKEVVREETSGRLNNLITHSYPTQLSSLLLWQLENYHQISQIRKHAVTYYQKEIDQSLQFSGFKHQLPYLCLPIKTNDPQNHYECAKKSGIYLGNWYYPAISPAGTNYKSIHYNPQDTPVSERMSRAIVNLPTYIPISDATRIVKAIKQCINK